MTEFNVAWLKFKRDEPRSFDSSILRRTSDQVYLENRLALAFAAGWRAAESQLPAEPGDKHG
jgi:hypothetical protein